MRKLLGGVLFVAFLFAVGCGQISEGNLVDAPVTPAKTSTSVKGTVIGHLQDVFAGQYDRWYNVTLTKVNKVGKKIGNVDEGTDMPRNATTPQGPGGLASNVLPVGSGVYEIPGINPTKTLAVQWDGQYVEAVRTTKRNVTLPDKTVLGWNGRLYKVIAPIDATDVGHQIGTASYHGKISGSFAVMVFDGSNRRKTVVFRSSTGDYFKAIATSK